MSSCFGSRSRRSQGGDHEPLLPQYHDDTMLQRRLHEKLHTYQMYRAIGMGAMPSNEQTVINLRTLLASDMLNTTTEELTDSGRLFVRYTRQFLQQFIDALVNKNSEDQLQDFIWYMRKSSLTVDTADLQRKTSFLKVKTDARAAYASIQTVGTLLLTNSDFRMFLRDLQTLGRQVFHDSALALSEVAAETSKKVAPSDAAEQQLVAGNEDAGPAPSKQDLASDVKDVSKTVNREALILGKATQQSLESRFSGDEKTALLSRLKAAVVNLRQKPNYKDSVSTITVLLQRYALVYSRAAEETIETAQEDISTSPELDHAIQCLWKFITRFGNAEEWTELQNRFQRMTQHANRDPDFEKFMGEFSGSINKLLSDPDFIEHADERFVELQNKSKETFGADSTIRTDGDALIEQVRRTAQSVARDRDLSRLFDTSARLIHVLSPSQARFNSELFEDSVNTFIPLILDTIQYIPIPRVEVSTPNFDLLLENIVLEPGKTVNHTSFLPYRIRAENYNDVEIRRTRTLRTASSIKSVFTIKIDGLSVRGEEIGFWLKAHSGFLRFFDEGLASFQLDERGVDIHLDVEVGREKLEQILSLQAVRVHIHKFKYQLHKSKFACIAWFLKPFLQPMIRKALEVQIAQGISDFFHAANRELVFARERLRATRIADPQDLLTFFKAVATRLTPADDPDLYARVGGLAAPKQGVFRGMHAPGSLAPVWEEEGRQAAERVEDFQRGAWRNDIFDVPVRTTFNSLTT